MTYDERKERLRQWEYKLGVRQRRFEGAQARLRMREAEATQLAREAYRAYLLYMEALDQPREDLRQLERQIAERRRELEQLENPPIAERLAELRMLDEKKKKLEYQVAKILAKLRHYEIELNEVSAANPQIPQPPEATA